MDINRSSLNRFPIFGAIGVAEVWCYDGQRFAMFRREGEYMEVNASAVLPPLTAAQVGVFLELGLAARRPEWLNQVRAWVQEHL